MKVKNYLWTLAAALTLVGCSDDLETQKGGPEEGTEQAKGEYYLYFSLDTPETKASDNPTGGEEGDGNEAGTYAENYVENVALFFVERTKGIQDAGAKIVGKLFIGEDELTHPEETAATTNYVKTIEPILISEKYYSVIKMKLIKKILRDMRFLLLLTWLMEIKMLFMQRLQKEQVLLKTYKMLLSQRVRLTATAKKDLLSCLHLAKVMSLSTNIIIAKNLRQGCL